MKKNLFILPTLALALFAACSGEEALTSENKVQQTTQNDAVTFDAYLNRTVTRAGYAGSIELTQLETEGFGVFAYYSDGELYSENAIPDFMYNQHVTKSGSAWTYTPLKYWPNEFGSSAVSTGVDRVTFFAYAPYVSVDPSTGQLTGHYTNATGSPELSTETGITALTRNGKTGDPYVRYVGAFNPTNCVDLLYGVAAEGFSSSVGATDGANSITAGSPFINVAKPGISSKLKFNFKHTLAKLTVQVDADVDLVDHSESDAFKDDNTRIWIRSITFDGIADRGYLNMNSGMWYEVMGGNKISHASVTVYDGRRDGAEPIAADDYETPQGINTNLVQSVEYATGTKTENGLELYDGITTPDATVGVTHELQNLFGETTGELLVIPANEQLKVTIVYDVETADATLPNYLSDGKTKGSTVENRITKAITIGGNALKLEAGKAYTLNLHLGMTSVKFDADVVAWDTPTAADNTWLPENGDATYSITAPSAQTAESHNDLAVEVKDPSDAAVDMTSGYTFSSTYSDNNGNSGVTINLSETGTATGFKVNLPALDNFFGRVYTVTATKTATGEKQTVNITQNAPTLEMATPTASSDVVTLAVPTVTPIITWDWTGTTVTVYDANNSDAEVNPLNYTWDTTAHTVTFTTAGSYKFILTKDESSTEKSGSVDVTLP